MSSPEVQKMLKKVEYHEAQYSELDAIFTEEWKKHFGSDWKRLHDSEVRKSLGSKGLADLLMIYDEMDRALEERFDSTKPVMFKVD